MQTYPKEARKAVAEAERKAAVGLHRFVRPFVRDATARWREREDIRNALANIRDTADEAWLCLEKAERSEHDLTQASTALREMEQTLEALSALPRERTIRRLTSEHECDAEIRKSEWAMSGYRTQGDRWKCSCGEIYAFVEDEAEGGGWWPQGKDSRPNAEVSEGGPLTSELKPKREPALR